MSKAIFHALAENKGMQSFASRYGMRSDQSFARRFVGGETVSEAIVVARKIAGCGMTHTLHYLGESVSTMAEADAATRSYIGVLNDIAASGIDRNVSLALTQLGLTVDRATCVDNLRRILDPAAAREFFVRIDMEDSPYTQVTLEIFETLWQQGYRNAGIVLQARLMKSRDDARRMNRLGARVRLVKGAYREPRSVAYSSRAQVDAAFVEIMQLLMTDGIYPAIATHDSTMIEATKRFAASRQIAADRFEFQMLYGIRQDLQAALTSEGYRVRVYVPFGREWFPYFMRRLGERPANLGYVLRTFMRPDAQRSVQRSGFNDPEP